MSAESIACACDEDKKWKAENDCRTLMEAEEIKRDTDRYIAAMKIAKDKQKEIDNLMANRPLTVKNG